jgi:hypothetical protein
VHFKTRDRIVDGLLPVYLRREVKNHIDIIHQPVHQFKVHNGSFDKIEIGRMVVAGPDIIGRAPGEIIEDNDPVSLPQEKFR